MAGDNVGHDRDRPSSRSRRKYEDDLAQWRRNKDAFERVRSLIAERKLYRFERHGTASAGNPRYVCPAQAGKIICNGCPLDAGGAPTDTDFPEVTAPNPLPKACSARTITVKRSVDRKLRQDLCWMSDEWIASYIRRSRIEAWFGILKAHPEGGVRRGWTRHVGLVQTSLMLALAISAINLRHLIAWARETGDTRDEIALIDTSDYGFEEYDAEGNLGAHPPDAA